MIRVYPPGRSPTLAATSLNSSVTAALSRSLENASLLLCVVSTFDLVTSGSTYCLSALALATVVLIRLCSIREQAIFASMALRCAVFLPKWFTLFPCLIVHYFLTQSDSRGSSPRKFSPYLVCILKDPCRNSVPCYLQALQAQSGIFYRSFGISLSRSCYMT